MLKDSPDFPDPWEYRVPTGGELKVMRKYLGLTQTEVEENAGVSYRMVGEYERNETEPGAKTLRKILTYYRMEYVKKVFESYDENSLP